MASDEDAMRRHVSQTAIAARTIAESAWVKRARADADLTWPGQKLTFTSADSNPDARSFGKRPNSAACITLVFKGEIDQRQYHFMIAYSTATGMLLNAIRPKHPTQTK